MNMVATWKLAKPFPFPVSANSNATVCIKPNGGVYCTGVTSTGALKVLAGWVK